MLHHTLGAGRLADLINPDPIEGIARGVCCFDGNGAAGGYRDRRSAPVQRRAGVALVDAKLPGSAEHSGRPPADCRRRALQDVGHRHGPAEIGAEKYTSFERFQSKPRWRRVPARAVFRRRFPDKNPRSFEKYCVSLMRKNLLVLKES